MAQDAQVGSDEPIAIVGVACRFPGAPDLAAFETLLLEGRDAVTEIPDGRWVKERFLHPDRGHRGKTYTFAAGTIGEVGGFDAAFFGISPREAAQMDPQQRLLLELAHEAIEDAGLDGGRLAGESVGVYVGGSSWDYLTLHTGDPSIMDAYAMTGATLCSLANRVSYALDLRGPSLTMDTACSSSLVALHQACEAIRAGQVPMALVGGVSLLLAPHSFVGFSAASMLSPRGRCHAFDERADGYVRSEGGAMIVLRPLRDALAAGDLIRAVVRGTGVNSDGRTTGFSLPNKMAQADLLRSIYTRFDIEPRDLNYVEAHGTGTPAGDPIEAAALGEVLGRNRASPLPIGSVKTNIGHLEAASGLAGLLKVVVALGRGLVPPSLHCETPNPAIPFGELNLSLVASALPMHKGRRLAGVNSFGFGGTNAHAVLESTRAVRQRDIHAASGPVEAETPLLLSARSEAALRSLATTWRAMLEAGDVDAALTRGAAVAREQHQHRLVVSGRTNSALSTALSEWLDGRSNHGATSGAAVSGKVAFVFSGNGSQWAGMGLAAAEHNPKFRAALAEVDRILFPMLGWSVLDRLSGADEAAMHDTSVAQPLLFATQVATVCGLRDAGVQANFFMGHSVGEVAAAWAAGALSLEQACRVIAARSQLQSRTAGHGRMGVLGLPASRVTQLIADTGVQIGAYNSSGATTVAGSPEELRALAERAEAEKLPYTALDLDHAFHSASMDPIERPLLAELSNLAAPLCSPEFVSTVAGSALGKGSRLDAAYWWRNVREPVRFAQAAAELVEQGVRIFIEVGPQPVLQAYLHDALRQVDATGRVVPTLTRRTPKGRDVIAIAAARCHVAGCDIRQADSFMGLRRHRGLPAYPWQREIYWLGQTSEAADTATVSMDHPLLGARRDATADPVEWSNHIGPSLQTWLADHVVGGATVAPAAAMVEIALAAVRARHPNASALEILDFEISRPLTFEAEALREVRLRVSTVGAGARFEISSRPRLTDEQWVLHASGRLAGAASAAPMRDKPGNLAEPTGHMSAAQLYAHAAELGLAYGPAFQTVASVTTSQDEPSAIVDLVKLAEGPARDGMLLPPTLVDGAFQGLVALAVKLLPAGDGVLPWRFGRIRLLRAAGAVPVKARLHVSRVGPRSVNADIVLLDEAGEVVAEALDCWFVRVALGAETAGRDGRMFHTVQVPSPDPRLAHLAGSMAAVALDVATGGNDAGPQDAVLFADAFVTSASSEALRALLPDPQAWFTASTLIDSGVIASTARPLLHRLLGWLAADGLAEVDGELSRLSDGDVPAADDILRTLVFDTPGAVADAALLSAAAENLAVQLRDGSSASVLPSASLADQFLHGSPAGAAAGAALTDAVCAVAQAWPEGQPLRVLQVGAWRGSFSRLLLRRLALTGIGGLHLDAVTDSADQPALARALTGFANARALTWPNGQVPREAAGYDLVIGFCPLSLGAVQADHLAELMDFAPGALLLLIEPDVTRSWSMIYPGAIERMRNGAGWCATLASAGGISAASRLVAGAWPAHLIAAQSPAAEAASVPVGNTLLVGAVDDPLAAVLASGVTNVTRCTPDALADVQATAGVVANIVLLPAPGSAIPYWVNALARCSEAITAVTRLSIVVRAGAVADPLAAAIAGLCRVIANESPDVTTRLIRIDPDMPLPEAAARVANEMCHPDAEAEVAWSARGRSVPRVRLGLPTPASRDADAALLRLAVRRPGMLDSLGWDTVTAPAAPGPGQIAIQVHAAGLNFRDVMWAMGLLPDEALLDGFAGPTLGLECAGIVTSVGPDVEAFAPGDRVMAFAPASMGSIAVTAAHAVMRMPEHMDFAAAATVPVAFLTVAYSLGHLAQLQPGESVLVHGGAGGVGLAAIQYARLRGATVFATAGSKPKRAMLRRLGVDAVFDSRSLGFADEIMRLTNGQGVDVVLNSVSGDAMELSLGLMRPFGRFLELGKRDFYGNTAVGLRPLRQNISYFGVDADQLPLRRPALAAKLFAEVAGLMQDGSLRPLPYRAFDAADVAEAFRLMQASGHVGKIVLELGEGAAAPVPRPVIAAAPVLAVRADRTYVVTGGANGFGLETARWLAGQGARHLALFSRRGPATDGVQDALDALRLMGVEAESMQCDVADEASLNGALNAVRSAMPPVAGIVHAAVAMDDAILADLDEARFAGALHPKLGGVELLDRLTRSDPVELFVLFSSVTTVLGNPGQANYIAANAAAEAVIERRHRDGLPGLAVQWGPIGDTGYLMREPGVAKLLSRRLGGQFDTAAEALSMLPTLLASGLPVVGMAEVRWGTLATSLPLLRSALFEELHAGAPEPAAEIDIRELLENSTPEMAQTKLSELLSEEVARIMKTSQASIEVHRPLAELGMDSLMAVELRMAVEQRFGLSIPVLALSDGASLWALAGRMARSIGVKDQGDEPRDKAAELTERILRFEPGAEPGPVEHSYAAAAAVSP